MHIQRRGYLGGHRVEITPHADLQVFKRTAWRSL
jgi:hypothetical protein